MYYQRLIEKEIIENLSAFPVIAILGPRQSGKSTLAKHISEKLNHRSTIYIDLERPSDLRKLDDAEWFFSKNKEHLICIDEIQRKPELFPLIRSIVDEWGGNGHFMILGSASQDLIKQSSETLAGRISYHKLTPFIYSEINNEYSLEDYLVKGGFPRSLISNNIDISIRWRENFITTFIERDLLQWSGIMPQTMRRLWQMLANINSQTVNYSSLGNSLGISNSTVKNYIDLLSGTYMIDIIQPYLANTGKRIVKSPKIYISDTGLVNAFLGIVSFNQLMGHPALGSIWETLVLINLKSNFPFFRFYFYRTSHGAEIDFVIEYGSKIIAIECKSSLSPNLSKGSYISMSDIKAEQMLVISPVKEGWQMKKNIMLVSISEAIRYIKEYFGNINQKQ